MLGVALLLSGLTAEEFVQKVTVDKGPGGPNRLYEWCLQDLGIEEMPKVYLYFSGPTSHRNNYLLYTLFPFPTPGDLFGDERDTLYFQAIQYRVGGNVFSGLALWFKWPMTQPAFRNYLTQEVDTILKYHPDVKYLIVDNEPDHMWYRVVKGFYLSLNSPQACLNIKGYA